MRLLQEGACKLEEIGSYSEEELQCLLRQCGIPFRAEDSKVGLQVVLGTGTFWWAVFLARDTNPRDWVRVWDRGCWRAGSLGDSQQPGQALHVRPLHPGNSSVEGSGSRLSSRIQALPLTVCDLG